MNPAKKYAASLFSRTEKAVAALALLATVGAAYAVNVRNVSDVYFHTNEGSVKIGDVTHRTEYVGDFLLWEDERGKVHLIEAKTSNGYVIRNENDAPEGLEKDVLSLFGQ